MECGLPDVLRSVAAELKDLADRASSLQDAVAAPDRTDEAIAALQDLDYITQVLGCLAPFMTGLALATTRSARVRLDSALDLVPVSALARRLSGSQLPERVDGERCELF